MVLCLKVNVVGSGGEGGGYGTPCSPVLLKSDTYFRIYAVNFMNFFLPTTLSRAYTIHGARNVLLEHLDILLMTDRAVLSIIYVLPPNLV